MHLATATHTVKEGEQAVRSVSGVEVGNLLDLTHPANELYRTRRTQGFVIVNADGNNVHVEFIQTLSKPPGALLDVAFCVGCGEKLYYAADRRKTKAYTYWRCSGRTRLRNGCQVAAVPADHLEEIARESIMEKIGDREVTVPVFVPGEDHAEELEIVREAIASARRERDLGLYDGDEEAYLSRLGALVDRRKVLEAMPSRAAGWTRRGTGEAYARVWEREDNTGKRRLLLDSGIKIKAGADPFRFSVYVPENLLDSAFPVTPSRM